jgi:hypothetical protein
LNDFVRWNASDLVAVLVRFGTVVFGPVFARVAVLIGLSLLDRAGLRLFVGVGQSGAGQSVVTTTQNCQEAVTRTLKKPL